LVSASFAISTANVVRQIMRLRDAKRRILKSERIAEPAQLM
jgi:hypothetical protein